VNKWLFIDAKWWMENNAPWMMMDGKQKLMGDR